MRNKVTALLASTLTLIAFAAIGYKQIGAEALVRASIYATMISIPLLALTWKMKNRLLKSPGYLTPLGMHLGTASFKLLYPHNKLILVSASLLAGILFVFMAMIYTDKELEQKKPEQNNEVSGT